MSVIYYKRMAAHMNARAKAAMESNHWDVFDVYMRECCAYLDMINAVARGEL